MFRNEEATLDMNFFRNCAVKAILHMLFFAVLLKVSALVLTWFWNSYLIRYSDLEPINSLEAVGVVAFGYLVFAGIRFGFNQYELSQQKIDLLASEEIPNCKECAKATESATLSKIRNFDRDDQEKLKETIAKYCGINHNSLNNNSHTASNTPYRNSHLRENEI
ncbi:MAG: hypothetical protein CVV22_08725 [Ignavibacteriae bacterium HGW-Ignavibacteriae-1]|jgi:hypothetical protein|nr:MAG: hypothetical protein CVV22_08725 [Ignavibacteriae bacterium HGW-Ignavibacteriae-1]